MMTGSGIFKILILKSFVTRRSAIALKALEHLNNQLYHNILVRQMALQVFGATPTMIKCNCNFSVILEEMLAKPSYSIQYVALSFV